MEGSVDSGERKESGGWRDERKGGKGGGTEGKEKREGKISRGSTRKKNKNTVTFCKCLYTSFVNFLNNILNNAANNGPARSNLFAPKWSLSSNSLLSNAARRRRWTMYPKKKAFLVF